jgi:YD repeat-containing protein
VVTDYSGNQVTVIDQAQKGRLASVVRSSGDGYYYDGYDAAGRVAASRQVTDGQPYSMSYGYDLAGNMTKEVYPSGKDVRMVYDAAGRLSSVSRYISGALDKTYASQFSYTSHGAPSQVKLGNNLWEHTNFNSRLQPERIGLGSSPGSISVVAFDYTYGTTNNNGNVLTQTIRVGGATPATFSQSYTY